jgi:hypothetical protein
LKLKLIIIFILFCVFDFKAQSYQYSYTDPCTGVIKSVTVPINGTVTVYYYGTFGTFSNSAFYDGTFETWMATTVNSYQGVSPCSQTVGINTAVNVTQSQTLNTLSILSSLAAVSDMAGSTNILGGATSTIGGSGNGDNSKEDKENNNGSNGNTSSNNGANSNSGSNPNNTGGGTQATSGEQSGSQTSSTGTQSTQSTTQSGTQETSEPIGTSGESQGTGSTVSETGGTGTSSTETTSESQTQTSGESSGSGTAGSSTESTSGNTGGEGSPNGSSTGETTQETQTPPEEAGGKTNITAGSTQTIRGSTSGSTSKGSASSKSSKAPSVVASSDFVGFNFKDSETDYGAKFTGGYTSVKWDGSTSYGVLVDYTSALKGPNITGFHAWIKKGAITLASGTLTLGFDGRGSVYGTLSGGQMRGFKGKYLKPLKVVYMGTVSYGQVFKSQFIGTAAIVGGMYDIKLGKRIDVKLMALGVYAPYVSYYNDLLLKSPFVALPSVGVNLGITKKFKFNINAGGSWALGQSTLNYTVTCGTRLLIGE